MKKIFAVILSILIVFSLFGCSKKEEAQPTTDAETTSETTTKAEKVEVTNPLTGESDYNESAVGVRPVAVVVENHYQARPQWGITTPDIIVEGEVEGGISRMLWLYADYTSLPSEVGPIRSARPSFVKFSELFDSIYIHWGGSHSKSGYVGGYETIKNDGVDDIDGMNGGELFSRDKSRNVSSEHTGVLNGEKLSSTITSKKIRTDVNEDSFTTFSFNKKVADVGNDSADAVNVKFSSRTDTRAFKYDSSTEKYTTSDWKEDVSFENVIVLMDKTTYVTTPYKSSTTTYLNYTLESGTGYLISNGTKTEINWQVKNSKLSLTDSNGKVVNLNQGKSYIALASSNNGGTVSF